MRSTLLLVLSACAGAASAPDAPVPASVRARLAQPTKLLVVAPASSGSLTASRYTPSGWQTGTVALAIANGELDAHATSDGALAIDLFAIDVATIDLPTSVFGKPVALEDVRLALGGPSTATTTWTDDDHANVAATVALDLQATLAVDGNAAPLAAQHLPPLPLALALSGTGAVVDATITLDATGTLWSWADLFELNAMALALEASSAY